MEKIFLALFATIFLVPMLFAQDIITLKNGDDIQAVVQEIDEVDIKYKKYENLDGPIYILKKTNVFMIRYANGSKDVFSDVAPPLRQEENQHPINNQSDRSGNYESFIISRSNDNEMAAFLKENDAVLYDQFQRGITFQKKGKDFVKAGLIVTGTGMALFFVGLDQYYRNKNNDLSIFMIYPGIVISIVGPCVILTSIPFYATGGSLKKSAVDSYERKHYMNRSSHQPSLDFNFYGNGVGFAIRF